MTVAVGTELGVGSGLGAGSALGAGTGPGAGPVAGAAAGMGGGMSFGRAAAVPANDRSSAGPNGNAALGAGNGASEAWLNATTGSEAPIEGKQSFKANWQSMLHALGVAEHPSGEAPEGIAGQSEETDATNESGGQDSRGIGARAFVARETGQSTLALGGRKVSIANTVAPANGSMRANQSTTKVSGALQIAPSVAAWSATKSTGSIGNSSPSSKIGKRQSTTPNAVGQEPAAQWAHGIADSPVDAAVLPERAAPFEANIPTANAINSSAPSLPGAGDVPGDGRAMIAERPVSRAIDGSGGTIGVPSEAPATAAPNPVHAAQTPLINHSMNSRGAAAIETQEDQQEAWSAAPQSALTAAVATAMAPTALSATHAGRNSDINEQQTAVPGFLAHRGIAEASAASDGLATQTAGAESPSAEIQIERTPTPVAKTARDVAAAANPAASQQNGSHVVVAQTSGVETFAMVRDPAGAHGVVASAAAGSNTSAGEPAAAQDTFSALDAGATVGTPSWIHAGSRQAEAGFEDPALGWVGVRADLNGGSVHAAVVAGSTEAAQALSGHLAGLGEYLSENHTPVATLTVAAPDQSLGQGIGQGMQQNAGQQGEQNQAPALQIASQPAAAAASSATGVAASASGLDPAMYVRDERGTHVSVMA